MGQKANSISLRLGVNKTWYSKWFDEKNYMNLIHEDLQIRKYLYSIFKRMDLLVGKCYIKRSIGNIFIHISIFNPQNASSVVIKTDLIEKLFTQWTGNKIHISIVKESDYTENASLLAEYVARQLEKRVSSREILKRTIQQVKLNPKIKGIRLNCSGRLDGAEIARVEWVKEGQVSLHSFKENIDYGVSTAHTIYGVCGVKVWICYQ